VTPSAATRQLPRFQAHLFLSLGGANEKLPQLCFELEQLRNAFRDDGVGAQ